jgi:hypothetical protein
VWAALKKLDRARKGRLFEREALPMPFSTVMRARITNLVRERGGPGRPRTRDDRRSSRPVLEFLEDRTLLATDTVSSTADSGSGSLRALIASASAGDTIDFASTVTGMITLSSGDLNITKNLDIEGPGAGILTISGGGARCSWSIAV